jgi:rRNA maturation endonuclease Nob1
MTKKLPPSYLYQCGCEPAVFFVKFPPKEKCDMCGKKLKVTKVKLTEVK